MEKECSIAPTVSPVPSSNRESALFLAKDRMNSSILKIKEELADVNTEIATLRKELSINDEDDEINNYIKLLHDYNDLKDAGQTLLGRLAEHEGTTTKEMYMRFGLELDD